MKTFQSLVEKYEKQLIVGLSPQKLLTIDFMDLNKQAIALAQKEYKKTVR